VLLMANVVLLVNIIDVGKCSFVSRTVKSWNQLPAGLLASFPCKLNTFRERVKNVGIKQGNTSGG
jgi:hypothetical protein